MESMEKAGIKLEIPYREKISRLFIFRMLWVFVLVWPGMLIGIWIYVVGILEFFYMLILGKRQRTLWENCRRYFVWTMDWNCYMGTLTDKRPSLWW